MTRIVSALPVLLALVATLPAPAQAQHAGHTMPEPAAADPHAGHSMPGMGMPSGPQVSPGAAQPAPPDPHAAHRRNPVPAEGEKRAPRPATSHGGHAMPAPATRPNPHAGHMPGMTMPSGAHAGHTMPAPQGASGGHSMHGMPGTAPAADPHAGHRMPGMAMPSGAHAGHTMPAPQGASGGHSMHGMPGTAPAADPHAGHRMPGMAMPGMTMPPGPHAGHSMAPMGSAPAASDPHAGHTMPGTAMPGGAHAGHSMDASAPSIPQGSPPAAAFTGPRHAADGFFNPASMAGAREQLRKEQGDFRTYKVLVDRLESRFHNGKDGYLWDAQGWYGGDINRLWIKTEGEGSFSGKFEEAEFQTLWGRAISPWWDLQAGARHDIRPGADRSYGVLGIQGLAPYYFEIDAAAFLSTKGDVTARLEAEYDQLITQKLILQPRLEMNLAAQDVRELDIGAGLSSIDAGLRLRYEFVPEFAPYIGVEYSRRLGKTARFARDDGEDVGVTSLLVGLRMWF